MSKAEELASKLERAASNQDMGRKPDPKDHRRQAAAHLRALDASHQRLKEALEGMLSLDRENHQRGHDDEDVCAEVADARAALEQAKDLS